MTVTQFLSEERLIVESNASCDSSRKSITDLIPNASGSFRRYVDQLLLSVSEIAEPFLLHSF